MQSPIDDPSWLYFGIELAFIGGWGFLHIYFRVMRKLGLHWDSL